MMKKIGWLVMTFLALVVAAYAVAAIAGVRSPFVAQLVARTPVALIGHLLGGAIAIAAGAFQMNSRLRNRFLSAHRWTGRLYVTGVLIGGVSAIALAVRSDAGTVAHFGFGLLATCWLASTAMAWLKIRRGIEHEHRLWMYRSYALTLAAVTLRLYLPISGVLGLDLEMAYPMISWLCWVPNLIFVEWFLAPRITRAPMVTA